MAVAGSVNGQDLLARWIESKRPSAAASTETPSTPPGLRFAFYGRTSTTRHQDRATSQGWQREASELLIAGHGTIVSSFFDAGCSRRRPWIARPQAARLLTLAAAGSIDAVVVGEYERAFCGTQFHRVLAAMHNQATQQGRYLGGRPPYGYRLTDAGPHPNTAQASWGRRLQQLTPDPATAPHVAWMFTQRLTGRSRAGIARDLNTRGIPCPSHVDHDRNRHRVRNTWNLRTVAVILTNPRYTGRQVWGRRPTTKDPDRLPAISTRIAHPPLVSETDFLAAQQIRSTRITKDGSNRVYALAGFVQCGLCTRRMDSHWVHNRPGYRCRHGHTSAHQPAAERPKTIYLREDHLINSLTARLDIDNGLHGHSRTSAVATELRARGSIVVCCDEGWTLTAREEGTLYTASTNANGPPK
ncbi:recombinase family protein [Amycolatopsis sp. lyj-112]|uniref:recombinase family protein n=1 Tax=Amycolatopsis sp. lyj-112 TaxID=2789288 RepID=UPI0039795C14